MTKSEKPKPQLHYSMLEMMYRCGIQFQRRYGHRFDCWHKEEVLKPGVALVTGSATHQVAEKNLRHKMDTGALMNIDAVGEAARDAVVAAWEGGIQLTDDEAADPKATMGATIDMTVALSTVHHLDVAPLIVPVALEEPFVITLPNHSVDLSGTIDVREVASLGDLKTAAKKPSGNPAMSLQLAMYTMDYELRQGALPEWVHVWTITKTKKPAVWTASHAPTRQWMKPLKSRLVRAIEFLDAVKGGKVPFTPVNSDGPSAWVCSRKYCGFADTCEFFSGRD